MDLVVDASIAFKWLVTEADSGAAVSLFQNHNLIAPDVLLAECRNAALTHVRRGTISIEQAKQAERDLEALRLHTLPSTPFLTQAFTLALEFSHPIYDCIYLAGDRQRSNSRDRRRKIRDQGARRGYGPEQNQAACKPAGLGTARHSAHDTPSFFCRLVDEVVYWNTSRLSG